MGAEESVIAAAHVVAILGADALAGLRVPVVLDGRVLAAIDRPEERVVQRVAAQRRHPVGRNQKAGRAVPFFRRVVQDRQIEHRHALHRQHCLPQQRIVIDVQDDRVGVQVPARRRLHARRKAAVRDLEFLRSELFDFLSEEVDDGILPCHRRRCDAAGAGRLPLRRHRREAPCVVEGAQPRPRVEFRRLRRDAVVPLGEKDIAGRDRAIFSGVRPQVVGVDLRVGAEIHFDMADEMPVLLIVRALAAIAARRVGDRRRRGRCARL